MEQPADAAEAALAGTSPEGVEERDERSPLRPTADHAAGQPPPRRPTQQTPQNAERQGARAPADGQENESNDQEEAAGGVECSGEISLVRRLTEAAQKQYAQRFLRAFLMVGGDGISSFHFVRSPDKREFDVDPRWERANWPQLHCFFNQWFKCRLNAEVRPERVSESEDARIALWPTRPHHALLWDQQGT